MVGIQRERWCCCLAEQLQFFTQYFDGAGRHDGIDRTLPTRPHPTGDFEYVLAAHPIRQCESSLGIRVKNNLNDAFTIAHIEEYHSPVVPSPVNPTVQGYRAVNVRLAN